MLSLQHLSTNCNPMPNTLIFLDTNTIAFCFRDQVALYNLTQNCITMNLNYRQAVINRANCLCSPDSWTVIVGYDSGHVVVYERSGRKQGQGEEGEGEGEGEKVGEKEEEWSVKQVLKQDAAIGLLFFQGSTLITNNFNAQVVFYTVNLGSQTPLTLLDDIKFPLNRTIQSITQITHKGSQIVFLGGIDQKVHCYSRSQPSQPLLYNFQLSGHQNSITKLAITTQKTDYLLASSSKDGYIRIWRITQNQDIIKFHKNVEKFDNFHIFLDAVLINHQSSVTDLKWVHFVQGDLQLVSCSLDCTICVWGVDELQGVWIVKNRMGQFLGNKNAYFSIQCDPTYQYLVSVNYIGSALIWNYNKETKKFVLRPSFNGHTNEVKDIDWDHTGNFLVSVSKDQTTRILSRNSLDGYYHEISRAQVHGYDINAVSTIKVKDGLVDLIACGADEKVIRIVQPPACFANYLNYFTKANLHLYFPSAQQQKKYTKSKPDSQILEYETYAEGGTQVLGLMTKVQQVQRQKISSYYDDEQYQAQQQQQKESTTQQTKINFTIAPHDDYLVKHTLWPEMNKLYGHPHQISALAKNDKRKLLASSCEGKTKVFCAIIIWSTQDWKIKATIQHHSYTVYSMDFSPCGKYLASVSKDRKLAIYNQNFQIVFTNETHLRAITSVSFNPSSTHIITGSRDKHIQIHSLQTKSKVCQFDIKKQVYSVVFCTDTLVAVGCADGSLVVLEIVGGENLKQVFVVQDRYSHTKVVRKLRYRNGLLASCSDDHSVRIFKLMDKKEHTE